MFLAELLIRSTRKHLPYDNNLRPKHIGENSSGNKYDTVTLNVLWRYTISSTYHLFSSVKT